MKLIFYFLCFTYFWPLFESDYRLYHSHYPILNNDHDCFYRYENSFNGLAHHLAAYCIRYNSINLNQKCLGTTYTFDQLRSVNITSEDLWQWFAPVDVIDNYAAYLLTETTNHQSEQIYCNCSDRLSFGTHCQYLFMLGDEKSSFNEIVNQMLLVKKYDVNDVYLMDENNSTTCYILFNCTTHTGFCLDWREINDGFPHCKNGEDEKYFIDMELNECNSKTEYRCRNGLCIPRSFLLDRSLDCPDWHDEPKMYDPYLGEFSNRCSTNPSTVACEEHKLGLNFFPCGDGQHVGIMNNYKYSCLNFRNALLIKTLFRPYFHQIRHDPCNLTLLCRLSVICLFDPCPFGQGQRCEELLSSYKNRSCSGRFVFPSSHFIFSYVQLVYTLPQVRTTIYPEFLCWNGSVFDTPIKYSRLEIGGFDCIKTDDLSLESKSIPYSYNIQKTTELILTIQHLFSEYSYRKSHEQLYMCSISPLTISIHRVTDLYRDCFPWSVLEDEESPTKENQNIACNLPDRFSCSIKDKCIQRIFLGDTFPDCAGNVDEGLFIQCNDDFSCTYLREMDIEQIQWVVYQEVCNSNNVFEYHNMYNNSNDTDETNCELWPCRTPYNQCNGRWDRLNGCDEINCLSSQKTSCAEDEHPCANINSTTMDCLPLTKVSDRHIDCLFGTDEHLTLLKYALWITKNSETNVMDTHRHYSLPCWNHFDILVEYDQICNRKKECPLGDDELFCDWHQNSTCLEPTEFTCKNGTCISKLRQWCNGVIDCAPDGEDERFCYVLKPMLDYASNLWRVPYKPFSFDRFALSEHRLRRSVNTPHCHRGVVIFNKQNNIIECLCPPSYYGFRCQWQSERLTISYRVDVPPSFHRYAIHWIVFNLLNEYDEILTYEIMIHSVFNEFLTHKQLIYLGYPRFIQPHSLFEKKSVRIDVYRVTNISIELTSFCWLYSIPFSSFIPVTRLATLLVFEEPTKNRTSICQKFGPCEHGVCQIYLNTGNPFCRCEDGWFGTMCNKERSTDLCKTLNCSHRFGKCVVYNNHALCLCFLGRMGSKCEIPFDACSSIKCQNNGTCVSLDQRTVSHVCICPILHFGNLCQHTSAQLKIKIPANLTHNVIPMMVIHFLVTPGSIPGTLIHRDYFFHQNIHSNTELIIRETDQIFLSPIIFAQLYFNSTSVYGSYYLLAFSNANQSYLTTQIQETYHCPHANEHLNSSLVNEPWLKRIKFYHIYMKHLKCFYDEAYICFVDKNGFPDCLLYNHNVANCSSGNLCVNDGRCLQSKKLGRYEFACICPQCTAGEFCQIQLTEFSITLDSILAQIILTDVSLNDQPITIKVLLIFISLILVISLISNILSFLVFRHQEIRQIGCGYYLLTLSLMNQITITIFVGRVVYLIIGQIIIISNGKFLNISCRIFDFILQVCISFCDWLHACIACERTVTAVKGASFNKKLSIKMVKIILPMLSILVILTSVHQIFNHDLIEDPKLNSRVWCVIKYAQPWLRIYEICINILNNFIPLLINFICGIIILIALTINRKRVLEKELYRTILLSQMKQHKDLLIAPLTMIIAKLPLLIVSLSIKCMSKQWHIYLSLSAYCLSLLPLVATFMNFIWPSNSYMQKFKERFPCFK